MRPIDWYRDSYQASTDWVVDTIEHPYKRKRVEEALALVLLASALTIRWLHKTASTCPKE